MPGVGLAGLVIGKSTPAEVERQYPDCQIVKARGVVTAINCRSKRNGTDAPSRRGIEAMPETLEFAHGKLARIVVGMFPSDLYVAGSIRIHSPRRVIEKTLGPPASVTGNDDSATLSYRGVTFRVSAKFGVGEIAIVADDRKLDPPAQVVLVSKPVTAALGDATLLVPGKGFGRLAIGKATLADAQRIYRHCQDLDGTSGPELRCWTSCPGGDCSGVPSTLEFGHGVLSMIDIGHHQEEFHTPGGVKLGSKLDQAIDELGNVYEVDQDSLEEYRFPQGIELWVADDGTIMDIRVIPALAPGACAITPRLPSEEYDPDGPAKTAAATPKVPAGSVEAADKLAAAGDAKSLARAVAIDGRACAAGDGTACTKARDVLAKTAAHVPLDATACGAGMVELCERACIEGTVGACYVGCQHGSPASCGLLAERLRDGNGVHKNEKLAKALFAKGCTDGDASSCRSLAKATPSLADVLAHKADALDAACDKTNTPACQSSGRAAVERMVAERPASLPPCDAPAIGFGRSCGGAGCCKEPTCEDLGGHMAHATTLDACEYTMGDHRGEVERRWVDHDWCDGKTLRECPTGCGACPLDSDTPIDEPSSPALTDLETSATADVEDFERAVDKQEKRAPACRADDPCCAAWDAINASGGALGLKKVPAC